MRAASVLRSSSRDSTFSEDNSELLEAGWLGVYIAKWS